MAKIIAAINMTIDGYCDHTAVTAGEEIHDHYTELLRNSDTILYGRITFQLMEYWRGVLEKPTGNRSFDNFAVVMDNIPKIVFSHTLKSIDWKSATLAKADLETEVKELKNQPGKNILVGSPGLIVTLTNLNLIDEYQLCVHPVIAGKGLPLFKNLTNSVALKLLRTKIFNGGAVILYYEPEMKKL